MRTHQIKRIAILGGGITGWTVAAALAKGLRDMGIEIVLIDDPKHAQVDLSCVSATPACVGFHQWLGIVEKELIATTGAGFLLATRFKAWSGPRQDYFMPYSDHGFTLNRVEFPHYAIGRYLQGLPIDYDDYSLAAVAAKLGRFCHPSAQESSLLSTLSYGLTLNTDAYTEFLRQFSLCRNVVHLIAECSAIQLNSEGYITAISLGNSKRCRGAAVASSEGNVSADFYIDCSGQQGKLIGETLQVAWQSSAKQLPLTHVVSHLQPHASAQALPSYRDLRTETAGWIQTLYSQTHTEKQYFYHADFINTEQAGHTIDASGNAPINTVCTGRRTNFWHKNCLAIGEAAGNFSVLGASNVQWVQSAVRRFLTLFPTQVAPGFNAAEFNRLTHLEYDHIEDFHVLHYHLAAGSNTAYWQNILAAPLSDRLAYKLELFKHRGVLPFYEGETFSAGTWASLLLGSDCWPERATPLIHTMPGEWIEQQLATMKNLMRAAAEAMPAHATYLHQHLYPR